MTFQLVITSLLFVPSSGLYLPQFDECKLTLEGREYSGKVSQTSSSVPCQHWDSTNPHSETRDYSDDQFPTGSKKTSHNYCRNPTKDRKGPWCFTTIRNKEWEYCSIPHCSFDKCRWSGPGFEYNGKKRMTDFENECASWSVDIDKFKFLNEFNDGFHEGSRLLSPRSCRNPNGDPGGPWCIVQMDDETHMGNTYRKEYCNIPFCFLTSGISVLSKNDDKYFTHYSKIIANLDGHSVDLSFRLWNPNDWETASLRIALTVLAVPVSGEEMRRWGMGYEIVLKNSGATILPNDKEDATDLDQDIPGLINGLDWTNITISWSSSHLSVTYTNKSTPLLLLELAEEQGSIIVEENFQLSYISFISNSLFFLSTDYSYIIDEHEGVTTSSVEEEQCEVHVTSSLKPHRYMLLRKVSMGGQRELQVFLRSTAKARLIFKTSPGTEYPYFILEISESVTLTLEHSESEEDLIASVLAHDLISYWKWAQIEITIIGSRFQMFMKRGPGIYGIVDVINEHFKSSRWFAATSQTKSYWCFFCTPKPDKSLIALPPECSITPQNADYKGHQDVSYEGLSCLPWAGDYDEELQALRFLDGSRTAALNYCRNPTMDEHGSYCFSRSPNEDKTTKSYCSVRKCVFSNCRIAGTGDDFSEPVSKTRMNQTCQRWKSNKPHKVLKEATIDENFPERSAANASNYCRNPTKDMGGPWCYTMNPQMMWDLCDVPDCSEPEECTVIVTGSPQKKTFINPQWKVNGVMFKAKIWSPSNYSEMWFNLHPKEGNASLSFGIGVEDNTFLLLKHWNEHGKLAILKKKNSPHFLSSGKWTPLLVEIRTGEFLIRYQGLSEPFFLWKYSPHQNYTNETTFEEGDEVVPLTMFPPAYFSYGGDPRRQFYVGFSFPCDECQIEVSSGNKLDNPAFYPANMWLKGTKLPIDEIRFDMRGEGTAVLTFFALPSTRKPELKISLNAGRSKSYFLIQARKGKNMINVDGQVPYRETVFNTTAWTTIYIGLNAKQGYLKRFNTTYVTWDYDDFITPYFFTLETREGTGEVIWTVNCNPPEIDGPPINGGWSQWSEWSCSASCGGGRGSRTRMCTEPKPSAYGEACKGEAYMTGACNDFDCGSVSPVTLEMINYGLRSTARNEKVEEGSSLKLVCNATILNRLKVESPTTSVYWMRNGMLLLPMRKISEVENVDNYIYIISNAQIKDTGVYGCLMKTKTKLFTAISLYSVIVITDRFTAVRRDGQKLYLSTNGELLTSIYDHFRTEWYHDGILYKEYDVDVKAVSHEQFLITHNLSGVWTCSIHEDDLGLTWQTNWARLKVKKKATLATHMMEDPLTRPIFGHFRSEEQVWIFIVLAYTIVIVGVIAFIYLKVTKTRKLKALRKQRLQKLNEKESLLKEENEEED